MPNQEDMTETAKAVFNELSDKPATAGEIAQNSSPPAGSYLSVIKPQVFRIAGGIQNPPALLLCFRSCSVYRRMDA